MYLNALSLADNNLNLLRVKPPAFTHIYSVHWASLIDSVYLLSCTYHRLTPIWESGIVPLLLDYFKEQKRKGYSSVDANWPPGTRLDWRPSDASDGSALIGPYGTIEICTSEIRVSVGMRHCESSSKWCQTAKSKWIQSKQKCT